MKITRVKISNYRSIKHLEFQPSNICAIVGENGAGKSNILAALDFLLGERYPQSHQLSKSDYFNHDENLKITIAVEFEPNKADIQYISFDQAQDKYQARYWHFGQKYGQALTNTVKELCSLVYVGADRDIGRQLGYSRYTLLGKIIRQFDASFPQTTVDELTKQFQLVEDLLRTDDFKLFESEMKTAFAEQVRSVDDQLMLQFQSFDPLSFYRSLGLVLSRNGLRHDLAEVGQGMRNLALLALFRAYAKTLRGDAIIAIEEPEIYLHPHAERSLSTLFGELADRGNQILFTTHSSNFLSTDKFDKVCLVRKSVDNSGDLCTSVIQVSAQQLIKSHTELHHKEVSENQLRERFRNLSNKHHSEAFFARKIILVEGPTEEECFPIYANGLGFDFDKEGVSIVAAGGKDNLARYYQLYTAFQIPTYLVFDNDAGSVDKLALESNATLLRLFGEPETRTPSPIITDRYAIFDCNFEEQMKMAIGTSKYDALEKDAKREWNARGKGQNARYMALQLVAENNIPEFIKDIVTTIKKL